MSTIQISLTEMLQTSFDEFATDPKALRALARNTKALWRGFTTDREKREPDYMSDKDALQAYVFSFLLPNLERTKGALTRYGNNAVASLLEKKQLRVLDLGCGPMSASLGLVTLLEELTAAATPPLRGMHAAKNTSKPKLPNIQITAVDRTDEGVEFALDVLKMSGYDHVEVKFSKELPNSKTATFDVVLIANALNEVSPSLRKKWIHDCFLMLSPEGICLILEPGQDDHSKALIEVRDEFLFGPLAKQTTLLGPCLHKAACPLGANSGRKDWCWFRHNWRPPAFLKALDAETELEHRELAYSFLLLQRNKVSAVDHEEMQISKPEARIVSDTITLSFEKDSPKSDALSNHLLNMAGESKALRQKVSQLFKEEGLIYKQLLCSNEGTLEGLFSESKAGLKSRGSVLVVNDAMLHGPERVSRSPRNLRDDDFERPSSSRESRSNNRSSSPIARSNNRTSAPVERAKPSTTRKPAAPSGAIKPRAK
jgi:SAM-dependent methyltransferase